MLLAVWNKIYYGEYKYKNQTVSICGGLSVSIGHRMRSWANVIYEEATDKGVFARLLSVDLYLIL